MSCMFLNLFLQLPQTPSIVFVCTVGSLGSTKWMVWFTAWWFCSWLYAAHMSVTMRVPGSTRWRMMDSKVAAFWSGTWTKQHCRLFRYTIPSTQRPGPGTPRWYLRWKNFDSSISTTVPGPPSCTGWSVKWSIGGIFLERSYTNQQLCG